MKATPRRSVRGRPRRLVWICLGAALAGGGAGCGHPAGSALVIVVEVSGSPPPITSIAVSISGPAGVSTQSYRRSDGQPLPFPTTLAAQLPGDISGPLTIDVQASSSTQAIVASGREGPLAVRAGETQTVHVLLECNGSTCGGAGGPDAATGNRDGGADRDGWDWGCGNGRIDPGETCDTGIAAGQPGACPDAACNDGIACTTDVASGDTCTLTCSHLPITAFVAGDGCCPAGGTFALDPDCSSSCGNGVIDAGETCDLQIAAGQNGACPVAADCNDGDPCTTDLLISAGTCAARCTHTLITVQSGARLDGCCPAGAVNEYDADCPVACGNGLVEDGELCDTGLVAPAPGACPPDCDDGDPCTTDRRAGQGCGVTCSHTPITSFTSGDGCCPAGGNRNTDSDCPAACGNGALEAGESCDKAITSGPGACPTACPSPSACIKRSLIGDAGQCTARCTIVLVTACSTAPDGCCPSGCTAPADPDCSPACGNGALDAGETCDIAITSGPGACPASCPACTSLLVAGGTCQATCVALPVTDFKAGDGCCPPGGTFDLDPDCQPTCGNGVTEPPSETCDAPATPGVCPHSCPPDSACTIYQAQGSPQSCDFRCVATTTTACTGGDGCCPAGCNANTDSDCAPVCGNGVLEAGERCDDGITAGQPGACDPSCDDLDPCTADFASGTVSSCSRLCAHDPITACAAGDGCCPAGCSTANDRDCASVCGDGAITGAETCDPPSSCPTVCPDDGDRCTIDRLIGDPLSCSSACAHTPITACSGSRSDLCCPTGCDWRSDVDC